MMSLVVRDPQVVGDIEWISVRIHGQSFMLHQIVSGRVSHKSDYLTVDQAKNDLHGYASLSDQ
jgi:tRNA U38,U39,U40 pseudouridine synthase TruA